MTGLCGNRGKPIRKVSSLAISERQAAGASLNSIAEEFGISKRSVSRILAKPKGSGLGQGNQYKTDVVPSWYKDLIHSLAASESIPYADDSYFIVFEDYDAGTTKAALVFELYSLSSSQVKRLAAFCENHFLDYCFRAYPRRDPQRFVIQIQPILQ
jgi:hypothetical protein